MLFKTRLTSQPRDPKQALINEEMRFLLEPDERWFEKNLHAHLLDEGCNFPMLLARPRFYELMLTGLSEKAAPAARQRLESLIPILSSEHGITASHQKFFQAMRFFSSNIEQADSQMAIEVTTSIRTIHEESQISPKILQEDDKSFSHYVEERFIRLWNAAYPDRPENIPPSDLLCRRLYASLATSLLRKMNARQAFENEFHSIPRLLKAMQQDHAEFCRFMTFCRERMPYFIHVVSQTFWRTLETFRHEMWSEPATSQFATRNPQLVTRNVYYDNPSD